MFTRELESSLNSQEISLKSLLRKRRPSNNAILCAESLPVYLMIKILNAAALGFNLRKRKLRKK
jgi:hypothetical protein